MKKTPDSKDKQPIEAIRIGDRIAFRAVTRWGSKLATRVVNGFLDGRPTVRFGGWTNFIVQPTEVIQVVAAEPREAAMACSN